MQVQRNMKYCVILPGIIRGRQFPGWGILRSSKYMCQWMNLHALWKCSAERSRCFLSRAITAFTQRFPEWREKTVCAFGYPGILISCWRNSLRKKSMWLPEHCLLLLMGKSQGRYWWTGNYWRNSSPGWTGQVIKDNTLGKDQLWEKFKEYPL